MALRKRVSLFKFASERQGYPERGGGFPQKRGRFQSWRKLWPDLNSIILMWTQHRINTEKLYLISKEKKQHGHRRRRYFSYLYKFNWYGLCIYQISDGLYLFYTKLLQVKKSYTEYSFAENDKYKLLKGNRLLANAFPSYFFIFKLIYLLTKWFKK